MNNPIPTSTTPTAIPDPKVSAAYQARLAAEIWERGLVIFARSSYRGGSRSEFYDNCTKTFISLLAGPLAKEIGEVSSLFGRPERKVAKAAGKALAAIQSAVASLLEDGGDMNAPLFQDTCCCEPEEITEAVPAPRQASPDRPAASASVCSSTSRTTRL